MDNHLRNRYLVLGLSSFFVIIFLALTIFHRNGEPLLIPDRMVELDQEWNIYYGEMFVKTTTLPTELQVGPETTYYASTTLPDMPDDYDHLLLRASLQDVTVYLDGELIHHKENSREGWLRTPVTSTWELVFISHDYQGKELLIELKSETAAFAGDINPMLIGSADALLLNILKTNWIGGFIGSILLLAGLVYIGLSFSYNKYGDNRILYLGLLAVSSSIWIIGESKLLQFITSNPFVIGALSYLMVPTMLVFMSLYIKEVTTKRFRLTFRLSAVFYSVLTLSMIILQQLNVYSYIELISHTWFLLVGLSLLQIGLLLYEWFVDKNLAVVQLFRYFSVLFVAFFIEAILFALERFQAISSILRIGFLIFFVFLFYDAYKYVKVSAEQERERRALQKLAYKDLLTDGFNRTAYERDLAKYVGAPNSDFRLILIDLNGLKQINDTYGHANGDHAIITVHHTLEEIFTDHGTCYRLGGDEFAIIMSNGDRKLYQNLIIRFRHQLLTNEHGLNYPIDVAIGSDVYHHGINFNEFYHHVDQLMYQNKRERKRPQDN